MEDGLLTIGEFSAACGLSARVLRSYAAAGLLVPAAVDHTSGYRYYRPAQTAEAETIRLLRQAGIPLAEIGAHLRTPTEDRLDRWARQLDDELRSRRGALAEARRRLARSLPLPRPNRPHMEGHPVRDLVIAHRSDTGPVRDTNQDAVLAGDTVLAVADGLGGGGEIASALACASVRAGFERDPTREGLVAACRDANRAVRERAGGSPGLEGMGTTLTVVARPPDAGRLVAVSSGDSRLYRWRSGRLVQLTEDDSVVGALIRAGELTEDEGRRHPQRRILTRALGVGPDIDPVPADVGTEVGDRFLICTDGLFNDLGEDRIAALLAGSATPGGAVDELCDAAASAGGNDNVTVVVFDVAA